MGFGIPELLIILLIVGLLFGTKKLRNMGGDLGSAIKSFKHAVKEPEEKEQLNNHTNNTAQDTQQGSIIEGELDSHNEEAPKS